MLSARGERNRLVNGRWRQWYIGREFGCEKWEIRSIEGIIFVQSATGILRTDIWQYFEIRVHSERHQRVNESAYCSLPAFVSADFFYKSEQNCRKGFTESVKSYKLEIMKIVRLVDIKKSIPNIKVCIT